MKPAVYNRPPAARALTPPSYYVGSLAFSPDGEEIAFAYLKMVFGIFTWTPTTGRSTSCVMATLPAMLTS